MNLGSKKVYIAGHRGLVGAALVRRLLDQNLGELITASRSELNLEDETQVKNFLEKRRPDIVIVAAAMVGGIHANNTFRTEFLYRNLKIQNNLIYHSYLTGVDTLVFLGSSCIYPKLAPQPIREDHLLSGPLEITNRPYALAKIAGIELTSAIRYQYHRNFYSLMPTNLYGPGDNFDLENSHVIPALIRKFVSAVKEKADHVSVWGSGNPRREFLYVDDLAEAIIFTLLNSDRLNRCLEKYKNTYSAHLNVGFGSDIMIREVAELIARLTKFDGKLVFDTSKPDGTPRKLMDSFELQGLGWFPKTDLVKGLEKTISWYCEKIESPLENKVKLSIDQQIYN